MAEQIPKERYKSYRAYPVVITFPEDIDDEDYDKLRTYLYEIFPVSMIEQLAPKIVVAIIPEGMVPAAKDIKELLSSVDVTVDDENYEIYIERRK